MNSAILDAISNVAKNEGFKSFEVKEGVMNQKGEGFIAQTFKVTVEDKESDRILDLIVKQAFEDDKIRNLFPIRDSFLNEIHFYSDMCTEFQKLGTESLTLAKYYGGSTEEGKEFLILENLCTKGLNNIPKTENLDMEVVEFVFQQYGILHALTFAFKERYPTTYSGLTEPLIDVWRIMFTKLIGPNMVRDIEQIEKEALTSEVDQKLVNHLDDLKNNVNDHILACLDSQGDNKTILHGDCWSNNIMFKFNNDEKVEQVALIDWQLVRVGSPICDLSYMLYTGASKNEFDKLDHLLKVYYKSFSSNLENFGLNAEEIWPFEQLKKDWTIYSLFGVFMAIGITKIKLTYEKDVKDLADWANLIDENENKESIEEQREKSYNKPLYLDKMVDLFRHLYEINVI